ncbi:MAG: amidohydrolase [Gammaproteobacteria bacterium]
MRTLIFFPLSFAIATGAFADIAVTIEEVLPQIVDIRHTIHANPELSNREFETSKLVAEHLRELGIEVETGIAHTGVIGILKGGKPGPLVAIRADMDALPVTEDTGLPFASTIRSEYLGQDVGVMHACGHDIHTSVQLGVASALAANRDDIAGSVLFVFQPAEEGAPPGEQGGASMMLDEGLFEKYRPQAIFALHSFPDMGVGEVGYSVGPAFASSDTIEIKLKGKQAHGAWPHLSVDPIVMASQVVLAFQTIRSRTMNPLDPGVVTIGMINGGERHNIIPSEVTMRGTVRTYDPANQDIIEARMKAILDGVTQAAGGSHEFVYDRGNPVTYNNVALAEWGGEVLVSELGVDNVSQIPPVMGAEDFAFFAREVPGFYFRLGVEKSGTESGGLHTPTLRADDGSIEIGIRAMARLVIEYLNQQPQT